MPEGRALLLILVWVLPGSQHLVRSPEETMGWSGSESTHLAAGTAPTEQQASWSYLGCSRILADAHQACLRGGGLVSEETQGGGTSVILLLGR